MRERAAEAGRKAPQPSLVTRLTTPKEPQGDENEPPPIPLGSVVEMRAVLERAAGALLFGKAKLTSQEAMAAATLVRAARELTTGDDPDDKPPEVIGFNVRVVERLQIAAGAAVPALNPRMEA